MVLYVLKVGEEHIGNLVDRRGLYVNEGEWAVLLNLPQQLKEQTQKQYVYSLLHF